MIQEQERPPSPIYQFSYAKFAELTANASTQDRILEENKDHTAIYRGLTLNQTLTHVQEHVGTFLHESDEIHRLYQSAEAKLAEAKLRNAKLHDELQLFHDGLGAQSRAVMFDLPHKDLRARLPSLYEQVQPIPPRPATPRPTTPVVSRARRPTVSQQSAAPPAPDPEAYRIYGPLNPRWDGQRYYWARSQKLQTHVWMSIHQPRPEFVHKQCDHCRLYGHLKWDCPKYQCPHCKTNCGRTPPRCPKYTPPPLPQVRVGLSDRQ